ncbi:DUF86 domain-containing protein [Candidatus Kaiserbacteria bacterium]|nr:DUF86 domain-containing protein [Candidatus Kaiserbacteria bacterium]
MQKDLRIPLGDIIESCDRIMANVNSVAIEAFRDDVNMQDAVIRRFEIIGEATKKIPEDIRSRYPDVPWKEATGFRDVLIHDYPNVVIDEVYFTGKNQLPDFCEQIKRILDDIANQE